MRRFFVYLILSLLISFGAVAKTIEQKKDELKKIYEAGGISKIEYEKSIEYLENPEKEKKSKSKNKFSIKKKKKNIIQLFTKKDKDKDKEEITLEKIEELGEIKKLERANLPESMINKFINSGCPKMMNEKSTIGKCYARKSSEIMMSNFGKSPSWGQKYPGKMIQSMAMYEVFYASRLYQSRKSIERFKKNKYLKGIFSKKKKDEEAIRSLISMNKGRESMRSALGMNMETPTKEAIQKFWLLGQFLELGKPKKNEVNEVLIDRQAKLNDYKKKISLLKKKLEERKKNK